eukprot:g3006.t1
MAAQHQRQIQQMKAFILQEANEKRNEINIKTQHDFNLEKQMLVHNAKLKIQDEFDRKGKDREIQQRIALSAAVGASRLRKMQSREDMMAGLIDTAKKRAHALSQDSVKYEALLTKLIVQALIKMDELEVKVCCRQVDLAAVRSAAPKAARQYAELMKRECGEDLAVRLTVSDAERDMLPPPPQDDVPGASCSGGVVMKALRDRIVCNNTFDARLELIWDECKPQIRGTLFPPTPAQRTIV